ncbi:MAG: rhodanese-like domain-containing protein [Pseudomonadota bacterium]
MKIATIITSTALITCISLGAFSTASAGEVAVKITPKMASANVKHDGKAVTIMRNQNQKNTINPAFSKTSRKCPPFCIRPFTTAKGVETVGELEVISYAKKMSAGDSSIMLVDNRTPDWHKKGTIPGAVSVPFTKINRSKGADDLSIAESLELFGAVEGDTGWDFSKAKTLVMFCNGMWCGQSPLGIAGIMGVGYPSEKIKWYRGGMQSWESLSLTTVK